MGNEGSRYLPKKSEGVLMTAGLPVSPVAPLASVDHHHPPSTPLKAPRGHSGGPAEHDGCTVQANSLIALTHNRIRQPMHILEKHSMGTLGALRDTVGSRGVPALWNSSQCERDLSIVFDPKEPAGDQQTPADTIGDQQRTLSR